MKMHLPGNSSQFRRKITLGYHIRALDYFCFKKTLRRIKKVNSKLEKVKLGEVFFDKDDNLSKITLFKNHCEGTCMGFNNVLVVTVVNVKIHFFNQ